MIVLYEKDNSAEIIDYIGNEYYKSLYLYLNYLKYSIKNNEIYLYIQTIENDIKCLLLNYGNALHIFSKNNNYDIGEICDFIIEKGYSVICADENIILSIDNNIENNDNFIKSFGNIWELKNIDYDELKYENIIEVAQNDDISKIVDLLLSDEKKKKIYSKENLYNQILNRNNEKYGRNYIIKEDDTVIAHAGTGAENENIAVIGLVMVDEKFRCKGYATSIVKKICQDLINENKTCYLMTVSSDVERLYEKIGFYKKWTYGKLVRR